jgi:hypothetical protein
MGFTKLDANILQSSIMAAPSNTFKVWVTLLAACGHDGIARVSSVFISSVCHLPSSAVDKALEYLESPDSHSRSTNDDGRRIRRVDGGYFVINYRKYRAFTLSDAPEAVRQRRHREKERDSALRVTDPRDISASFSASSSVHKEEGGVGGEEVLEKKFQEFWSAYPKEGRLARKESRVKFGAIVKRGALTEFVQGFHGYLDYLKHQRTDNGFDQRPMYAKTFLNGRWEEFVGFKYEAQL